MDPGAITAETARTLASWAGFSPSSDAGQELALLFQAFHERVQRLYGMEVEKFQFDFLRPMD